VNKHSEGVLFILSGHKKEADYSSANIVPILFEKEEINIGGGMDVSTNVFIAPRTGFYQFQYSDSFNYPESIADYTYSATILLRVNGKSKIAVYIPPTKEFKEHSSEHDGSSVNFDSLLKLEVGAKVELLLEFHSRQSGNIVSESMLSEFARYSGRLVEEEEFNLF